MTVHTFNVYRRSCWALCLFAYPFGLREKKECVDPVGYGAGQLKLLVIYQIARGITIWLGRINPIPTGYFWLLDFSGVLLFSQLQPSVLPTSGPLKVI